MKYILILSTFISLVVLSSCQDDIDVNNLTNYPPAILSYTPKTSTKIGGFDVKVIFADGPSSPLASGSITLKDKDGNEIYTTSKTLGGERDSIYVEGTAFNASSLDYGDYTLIIKATDTKGQVTESTTTFSIVDQLYPANNAKMYIAGVFNSWGADEMELVAANTWEIKNIDLAGGAFKFKNTTDWSDADWGDAGCDGVVEVTTGGGPNTDCKFSGPVNVRFNDETLKYTVLPAVAYATNLESLYLLGSFNDFTGPNPQFTLVADHTWQIDEFRMKTGDIFRFVEHANFEGKNYGDDNLDGKAEEFGANIKLDESYLDAYYKITFNDATRIYTLTVARYPYPSQLYLVGGSTSADWNTANSIPFKKTDDGKFEMYAYLKVIAGGGNGFKFLQVKDWPGDWGKGDDGKLLQEGESNITVANDGFYRITVDFTTGTYTVQQTNWGLVGEARTGNSSTGWNADTDMTFDGAWGSYTWSVTMHLYAGEYKFRANDGWDINFGDTGRDGTLDFNSSTNMIIAAEGDYVVKMILDPVNGYKYTVTPQ